MLRGPRNSSARRQWLAEQDAAIERLATAAASVGSHRDVEANRLVQTAVDAARDAGVGWTRIGDTLGIAGGCAYQRYRKRPGG